MEKGRRGKKKEKKYITLVLERKESRRCDKV
jgi:hypothetical protein